MLHDIGEETKIGIFNSLVSFEYIYQKVNLSQELMDNLKKADILLVPQDFKGHKNCFPEQTYQFYSYLKSNIEKENLVVDIAASDEDYKEYELHADMVNISEVLIQWTLYPMVVGLITNYLYDLHKQRKKKINTSVKISVSKQNKTKTVTFEGDIESFQKAMESIKENIFDE